VAVRRIPRGRVTTYKEVAKVVGRPKAWRVVAQVLARNPKLIEIPCHRVIKSNGEVSGYKLGVRKKIELLRAEGVEVIGRKIDLKRFGFKF